MIMSRGQAIAPISIETKTIRKLKIRIIPFILFLYIVSFLDRINIWFAPLTMNQTWPSPSHQFGLAVGIFFIGYSLFEIPSNLLLHKIGARIWLARILITWGIISTLTGFVQNVPQLYLARFLLGFAEAGYFPGIILYLTYWFRRREQAQVLALLLIGIPITSILGAPLSGLILDHVHWLGLGSWRWLLILEGLPALVGGALTYYLLPSRTGGSQVPCGGRKGLDHSRIKTGRRTEAANSFGLGSTSVGRRPCLASGIRRFCLGHRVVHSELLAASDCEGIIEPVFQYRSRTPGDGSERCRLDFHGCHFPKFRPQAGAEMARGDSRTGGGNCLPLVWCNSLECSLDRSSVSNRSWYLRGAGPFWALPCEFLTGFAAASGIALVTSIANLGGFVGPYAVGLIQQRTGNLQGSLVPAGIAMLVFATLLLLLPERQMHKGADEE